ncbi:MAG: HNH endonuclease [Chloroflexi bacterium]|nr:HNH endonuclease [Chloroflexota bacterium]
MSRPRIRKSLRKKIAADAGYHCGYCLTPQSFTAMPMHVEHIIPLAAGGSSDEDNLWLACPLCNGHKGVQTHGSDPIADEWTPLFNPRKQKWQDHFRWSVSSIEIVGLTAIGRATVLALRLNHKHLVRARRRWSSAGWHPPVE